MNCLNKLNYELIKLIMHRVSVKLFHSKYYIEVQEKNIYAIYYVTVLVTKL